MTANRQCTPNVQEALAQMRTSPTVKEIGTELPRGEART